MTPVGRRIIAALTVAVGTWQWFVAARRRRGRLPAIPTPTGFVELVEYVGPRTLVLSPAVDGLPRRIEPQTCLLVDQDFAADLVETSRHWRYVG